MMVLVKVRIQSRGRVKLRVRIRLKVGSISFITVFTISVREAVIVKDKSSSGQVSGTC